MDTGGGWVCQISDEFQVPGIIYLVLYSKNTYNYIRYSISITLHKTHRWSHGPFSKYGLDNSGSRSRDHCRISRFRASMWSDTGLNSHRPHSNCAVNLLLWEQVGTCVNSVYAKFQNHWADGCVDLAGYPLVQIPSCQLCISRTAHKITCGFVQLNRSVISNVNLCVSEVSYNVCGSWYPEFIRFCAHPSPSCIRMEITLILYM